MLHVRFTEHIQEDLKRGWSSWNFGQEGFDGTYLELASEIKRTIEDEDEWFYISGFELYGSDMYKTAFGELRPNYWVVIDDFNAGIGMLSTHEADVESVEEAIKLMEEEPYKFDGTGDGNAIDASKAIVLYEGFSTKHNRSYVILKEADTKQRQTKLAALGCLAYYEGTCASFEYLF